MSFLFIITVPENLYIFLGLLMGMEDVKWNSKVQLVTMETEGSNCFNEALKAGKIVTLNGINRPVYVLKFIKYLIFSFWEY